MNELDNYFEIVKKKISEKYYDLYIMDMLANDGDYFFVDDYIQFNIVDIFFEPYKYAINICIESIDIKIQEFLNSKNIKFEVRLDILKHGDDDIYIYDLQYDEKTIQIILDILDFIYKNYLQNNINNI